MKCQTNSNFLPKCFLLIKKQVPPCKTLCAESSIYKGQPLSVPSRSVFTHAIYMILLMTSASTHLTGLNNTYTGCSGVLTGHLPLTITHVCNIRKHLTALCSSLMNGYVCISQFMMVVSVHAPGCRNADQNKAPSPVPGIFHNIKSILIIL